MQSTPETISSLKPNVSREDALRHFTEGTRAVAADILRGPARSMADLYIPYRLFQVNIRNDGREEKKIYAIDAVEGTLDLFSFPQLPPEQGLLTVKTRNFLPSRLQPEQATEKLIDKVRRLLFSRGFSRLRNPEIEAAAIGDNLYFPYWVCFRGREHAAKLEIMDAVRRKSEGGKVRAMVRDWLESSPENRFEVSLSGAAEQALKP